MDNKKVKGYAYGVIASVSYGLNPLFALPLYASGIRVDSVLFYRYVFALLFLAVMMKMSGQSFALKRNEILPVAVMGLLFSFSSLFLFQSFNYMDRFYHFVHVSRAGGGDYGRVLQRKVERGENSIHCHGFCRYFHAL